MLDYALRNLVDGISLPGILLILLPVTLFYWLLTKRRRLFLGNCLALIILSLPLTGKLLLYPLEIGKLYEQVDAATLQGKVDGVAVLSNGLYQDPLIGATMPSTSSFSRVLRGRELAQTLGVPLVISGTTDADGDKSGAEILGTLTRGDIDLVLVSGAAGTGAHATNVAAAARENNLDKIAVFVSGIHALRTKRALEAEGVHVPIVIVGVRDSLFALSDIVPSFIGFYYWKHALKEYAGLAHVYLTDAGIIGP